MQPVTDLHLLQFAEVIVQRGERILFRRPGRDACVLVQPDRLGQFDDLLAEQFAPPRIDAGGLVIFVDELFQVAKRAVAFRAGQRRGQMVDDDGGCTALGLGALARM
jgi:hypothetical protein